MVSQAEAEQTLASDRARSAAAAASLETRLATAEAESRETALSRDAEAASRAAAEVLVTNLKAQVVQLQVCATPVFPPSFSSLVRSRRTRSLLGAISTLNRGH